MRTQQASGITRGSCGSRLIEGGSRRYIRPRSEPFLQLCEKFTKRTDETNNFLKTLRDRILPDRTPLLLHWIDAFTQAYNFM